MNSLGWGWASVVAEGMLFSTEKKHMATSSETWPDLTQPGEGLQP